jgi:hypothetical protein
MSVAEFLRPGSPRWLQFIEQLESIMALHGCDGNRGATEPQRPHSLEFGPTVPKSQRFPLQITGNLQESTEIASPIENNNRGTIGRFSSAPLLDRPSMMVCANWRCNRIG